jgi:isoleucyl-tRNA synthetase
MTKFHLPSIEQTELKSWEDKGVLRQILERNEKIKDKPFVFFEGPPTANGKPGIHHVLARVFKDSVVRFRTMQGYRVDRKAGWDTHGLPVELGVEKELGFTKKQQIEEYGVAAFNRKCRESVWKYTDMFRDLTQRIGFWVDIDDAYVTYENEYIESLWWILKEISGKTDGEGRPMLYEGHRVTPHCPRCDTSLSSHELAQGYKDVDDPSVYVKMRWADDEKTSFLVWTTTPWTLPANLAVAVGEDIDYVTVQLPDGEKLVLAKTLLSAIEDEYEVVDEMKGADLVGKKYLPLYTSSEANEASYKSYAADFVSVEDGTGIVHIAPAYGEDDASIGKTYDLPVVFSVDQTATVIMDVPGKGKFFKEADNDIKADLSERGLLYRDGSYNHSYPFCWRCDTPLLYFAKKSWYIRMSSLRQELMKNNEDINWVPSHIQHGRFGEWLREAKDWALSRERYWGTPLPVWKCEECGEDRVIGGLDDFDEYAAPKNEYFLQRHGESEHNVKRIVTGWDESMHSELTEEGVRQIEQRANEYANVGVDVIYSSDIYRCKRTAEMIAGKLGIEVIFDERLRDIKAGELEGKSEDDFYAYFETPEERMNKELPGGESLRQQRLRMVAFLKEIDAKHEGKRILLVTHGDPSWALKTGIMQLDDNASLDKELYLSVGGSWSFDLPRRPRDEEGKVDMHRPFIDEIKFKCGCGGVMVREIDVLDCWFDSGCMPFAQWHYPFENKERIDSPDGGSGTNFPANYIAEAIDQTRGWFYTLLSVSTLLDCGTPYRNVICLGHIQDNKGQKMSKSKGNIVDPWEMMDKWGADAIRYYMFTLNQPGEPKRFDEKGLEEVTKKVFLILWNVLSFWKMFADGNPAQTEAPKDPKHALDRWLLAELDALNKGITEDLENYHVVDACRKISGFVTDLSTWYVRRSRDRFKAGDQEAVAVLGYALHILSKLMAPFVPFLADELYKELSGKMDSIHLDGWPETPEKTDEKIGRDMKWVRTAASAGLERREEAKIPVRQALASATVTIPIEGEFWMAELLTAELNVLEIVFEKGENVAVTLDTEITPELRRMGLLREIVRNVNALRKDAGLTPSDHVILKWEADGELWTKTIEEHGEDLEKSVHADSLERGRTEVGFSKEIEADGETLWIGFNKD